MTVVKLGKTKFFDDTSILFIFLLINYRFSTKIFFLLTVEKVIDILIEPKAHRKKA